MDESVGEAFWVDDGGGFYLFEFVDGGGGGW